MFIQKMLAEIKTADVLFYSPEKGIKQVTARPDYPSTAPAHGDSGFDPGVSFKIKGVPATACRSARSRPRSASPTRRTPAPARAWR
jgi:hypothetical protein